MFIVMEKKLFLTVSVSLGAVKVGNLGIYASPPLATS